VIACPLCGGRTAVMETRAIDAGTRRRRVCARVGLCPGRVTTVETVVSSSTRGTSLGRAVVVPKRHIEKLRKIVAVIGGGAT
jgi:transcriptional regulator NrdR family protein